MPSAVRTWKSWLLPTRQTAGVPAFRTAASTSSFSAERPDRLVMPKAVKVARVCGRVGEELAVGRVGAGPAAFDVVDAEGVQRGGDLALLVGRELDALGLLAVAQGGVEEGEAFAGHRQASAVRAL